MMWWPWNRGNGKAEKKEVEAPDEEAKEENCEDAGCEGFDLEEEVTGECEILPLPPDIAKDEEAAQKMRKQDRKTLNVCKGIDSQVLRLRDIRARLEKRKAKKS
jgi:hypothetical protein